MNKKYLAEDIAKRISIKKYEAYNFIDLFIEVALDNLGKGRKLVLSKFGTLIIKKKNKKRVINPINREPMIIPPTKIVKFIPAENLKKKFEGNG
ncbi:MAG: HU family DNA-binding protein [Acidobacteria bacterium]|jgi:DNA-binding protein HU-beta|nr:HU family DNA-binding protein [Acidobacteriota bacterium]MDD8012460.1 HU family DNA-binding protein [Acidobacteriota bacterium]